MYETVHAIPDGDATVARFALCVSEYGYEGMVVRNHVDSVPAFDADVISSTYDLDIVSGIEIRGLNPEQVSGHLGTVRDEYVIVFVHGGTTALNRFAVGQPSVDVLAHPLSGDGSIDHVMAREAVENDVRVEVNLSRILRQEGGQRVHAIRDLTLLQRLIKQYGTAHVVTADPTSHLQLRGPRELIAVGEAIGLAPDFIKEGLNEWRRLAERNRERRSESFVEPGVRRDQPKRTDDSQSDGEKD